MVKNNRIQKIIAGVVIAQFILNGIVVRAYAGADNLKPSVIQNAGHLRPPAAKKSKNLPAIEKDLKSTSTQDGGVLLSAGKAISLQDFVPASAKNREVVSIKPTSEGGVEVTVKENPTSITDAIFKRFMPSYTVFHLAPDGRLIRTWRISSFEPIGAGEMKEGVLGPFARFPRLSVKGNHDYEAKTPEELNRYQETYLDKYGKTWKLQLVRSKYYYNPQTDPGFMLGLSTNLLYRIALTDTEGREKEVCPASVFEEIRQLPDGDILLFLENDIKRVDLRTGEEKWSFPRPFFRINRLVLSGDNMVWVLGDQRLVVYGKVEAGTAQSPADKLVNKDGGLLDRFRKPAASLDEENGKEAAKMMGVIAPKSIPLHFLIARVGRALSDTPEYAPRAFDLGNFTSAPSVFFQDKDSKEMTVICSWEDGNSPLQFQISNNKKLLANLIEQMNQAGLSHDEPFDHKGKIVVEFSKKDGGVTRKTEISAQTLKQIRLSDEAVYKALSPGFGNFVNSLPGLENYSAGLIIGANTVFENAGTLSALKKIKSAQPGLKMVFWAKDKAAADKLKSISAEDVVDIVIADSLAKALEILKVFQVENNRIVLVNSDLDNKNIKEEFQVKDIAEFLSQPEIKGMRIVGVHAASTFVGGESVNTMPLVLARAIAAVYKNEAQVVKQYEKLSLNSGLSEDTLKVLDDMDKEFATVPLVKVSEEVAKAQVTYEETVKDI
jgi:hypothetical protein